MKILLSTVTGCPSGRDGTNMPVRDNSAQENGVLYVSIGSHTVSSSIWN